MKIISMRNVLIRFVFAFGTLFAAASSFGQPESMSIRLPGIKESVTVRRDARAIPYIEAKTDADLYFVQGYVTAGDRLWQMDLLRRVARGETAEIFGKMTLEEDKRWRRFNFKQIADESLRYLTPELRLALDSYAKGVNAYIATLDDKTLPVEFRILQYKPRDWVAADTVVVGKILADALSSTWRNDLLRASLEGMDKAKLADLNNQVTPYDVILFGKDGVTARRGDDGTGRRGESEPGAVATGFPFLGITTTPSAEAASTPPLQGGEPESAPGGVATGFSDRNAIVNDTSLSVLNQANVEEQIRKSSLERIGFYAEGLAASNNWVISGKRTADGKPLLANDPHLLASAPGIWYLTHLTTPTMRVSGVTFPGVPGIVLGHNENIAWGATNVGPDVQDLYIETFDSAGNYKTPNGVTAPVIRKEQIKVRANPLKADVTTETFEVVETRNGPIIIDDGAKKYSLKWTAFDPKNSEFESFFLANRAKDWNDFKKAFRSYGGATQNFVYADIKGNIGWYAAGRIPIRKTGDGAFPYDGSTNDGDWTGFIPFDELPNLYNPPEGFIVTANQRIVGTSYKYSQMSRDAAPPWRARRIYDLLKDNSKVTMDAVRDVQLDAFNIPLSNLAKEIVAQSAASPEDLAVIKAWDGRVTPDSKAALVVNEIRLCLANKIAADNKPAPAYLIRERILDWAVKQGSGRWLPKQFADYPSFIKSCASDSNASLTKRYGADQSKWLWENVSKSNFPHPLAGAPLIGAQFATPKVGLSGSGQTPNVGSYVSMRHVATPGNWDATRHVIPLGQSGNPQSPFFKDQFEVWRTGDPAVFPFSKLAVQKAATDVLVFKAETRP